MRLAVGILALLLFPEVAAASWSDSFEQPPSGDGFDGEVFALVDYLGELVAGGEFSQAGSAAAARLATWNGSSWTELGAGCDGPVIALQQWESASGHPALAVAGNFTQAGSLPVANIAILTGSIWTPLGSGTNDRVDAMTVYNGDLIVAGRFTQAGSHFVSNIARWDGMNWWPLGDGLSHRVESLAVWNGQLVAGGLFEESGSQVVNHIAAWDGTTWSSLGGGTNTRIRHVRSYGDYLIAAGQFESAGGVSVSNVARWDGFGWSALGAGTDGEVWSLGFYRGDLVAAGSFSSAGGEIANGIARWDGSSWSSLASGVSGLVHCSTQFGNGLYIGGSLTAAGGHASAGIAFWSDADSETQTYLVRPDGSGDFVSVQTAINASADGDVVELADGIFRSPGNRAIELFGRAIEVRSRSGDPEAVTCHAVLLRDLSASLRDGIETVTHAFAPSVGCVARTGA